MFGKYVTCSVIAINEDGKYVTCSVVVINEDGKYVTCSVIVIYIYISIKPWQCRNTAYWVDETFGD